MAVTIIPAPTGTVTGTVTVSSLPPVSISSIPLPPNAAQEAGGNLSLIANATQTMADLSQVCRLMLMELQALNLQIAGLTGASVTSDDVPLQ
jgi:hypothetical protein